MYPMEDHSQSDRQPCPPFPAAIFGTLTAADVVAVAGQGIDAGRAETLRKNAHTVSSGTWCGRCANGAAPLNSRMPGAGASRDVDARGRFGHDRQRHAAVTNG